MTPKNMAVAFCSFILGAFAGLSLMSFSKTVPRTGEASPLASPTPDRIKITPKTPASTSAWKPADSPVFPQEKTLPQHIIDFESNGEDLRVALQALAKEANVSLVISDHVVGIVTLRLTEIQPLKGIEIIATAKNLHLDWVDGRYYINTPAEHAALPPERQAFTFENAVAGTALEIVEKTEPRAEKPVVDVRTNTIIYQTRRSDQKAVLEYLKWLDRPHKESPKPQDGSMPGLRSLPLVAP